MKTINLYFDMKFTSLSPDAQPISLGIVSGEIETNIPIDAIREYDNGNLILKNHKSLVDIGFGIKETKSKYFYSEFSDFDINRCDDWVKENVVSKLTHYPNDFLPTYAENWFNLDGCGKMKTVKIWIKRWLSQFSDYQIQFVCDCGTFDWYWMLQLLAEWDNKFICQSKEYKTAEEARCKGCYAWDCNSTSGYAVGLPKLPENISPVPQDLNDFIAFKKGILAREAFDLNREELMYSLLKNKELPLSGLEENIIAVSVPLKHCADRDAKVIKAIYEKLK